MKSNAPWSVKGIERDARETAKEAARREGMTVGEWLNQMIYSQAEGGASDMSGGEVEGLKLKDLVTAMEHLRNRVAQAETKNNAAVAELSRNMGGFVERVQRLERVKPGEGTHQDLAQRIEKLERAGDDRQRIEALKALEKAVTQVATQFNSAQRTTLTRLDSAEAQLQEFAERLDRVGGDGGEPAELGPLKSTIESLAERVTRAERIAEEAASLKGEASESADPEFVERTGARLRVLGDEIKRGGDQIRAMEGAIAKLSGQIEAAEKRSADGVQKVADTIAEIRAELNKESGAGAGDVEAKLAEARRETDDRLGALQRSLETLNARVETLGRAPESAATETPPAAEAEDDNVDLSAEIEDALAETPDTKPAVALRRAPAPKIVTEDPGDVADEIEDAVADLETQAEPEAAQETEPETDPFAFSDEIEEEGEDEAADDFSFQLDEEAAEEGEEGDITVSADEAENGDDETSKDARSLLAEVRSALAGESYAGEAEPEAGEEDEDDDISALFADDDEEGEDGDVEDTQAPNTASLSEGMSAGAGAKGEEPAPAETPKEDMVQAARRRAREAAEQREAEGGRRPRRSQLTAKQRAILAARARQKRVAEEGLEAGASAPAPHEETEKAETPAPLPAAPADFEDDEEESPRGRFGKIAAALSSARARLGRKKESDDEEVQTPEPADERIKFDDEDAPRRNGDRAALETLQSTASARPLTMALAFAIVLAIAALVYLMKDFIFKPAEPPARPAVQTEGPAPEPAAGESEESLATVPQAPALDPQALYLESMDALSAAQTEDDAMEAVSKLQDAAALGFPPAQLQLGELYKTGQGVEQDLGQARVWFRRAANGGNVLAMHRIGVMTARGDGGVADPREAIAWFEKAANFGLVDSQYNLGAIYHPSDDGASSVQDAAKAYYWYSLAARNGDDQAQPLAAGVGVALSPEERADIDARVAAWTAKPADESANASAAVN